MATFKHTSVYVILILLTLVISCEARKLLPERSAKEGYDTTITKSSPSSTTVAKPNMTIDDNRPTMPGHSPGVGHA
jgi:hypothetical protein